MKYMQAAVICIACFVASASKILAGPNVVSYYKLLDSYSKWLTVDQYAAFSGKIGTCDLPAYKQALEQQRYKNKCRLKLKTKWLKTENEEIFDKAFDKLGLVGFSAKFSPPWPYEMIDDDDYYDWSI